MAEGGERYAARRALRGLGKYQLAQFGEQGRGQAQQTIGQQQPYRHHQNRGGVARLDRQRVDQVLEQNGNAHVRDLGRQHEQQRGEHAPLVFHQIGNQTAQCFPIVGRRCGLAGGGLGGCGGWSHAAHRVLFPMFLWICYSICAVLIGWGWPARAGRIVHPRAKWCRSGAVRLPECATRKTVILAGTLGARHTSIRKLKENTGLPLLTL